MNQTPVENRQPANSQVVSGNDALVANVVARQPAAPVARIETKEVLDLYKLPEGCRTADIQAKYSFKWVGKNERQINRATEIEGWVLCTRQNAPFIDDSYFKVHGAVEKSGMLLAFMLKESAEARNARYRNKHNARKKALKDMKNQPNFYEAKLSPKEADAAPGSEDKSQGRDFS